MPYLQFANKYSFKFNFTKLIMKWKYFKYLDFINRNVYFHSTESGQMLLIFFNRDNAGYIDSQMCGNLGAFFSTNCQRIDATIQI